jgi:hypothetical protein
MEAAAAERTRREGRTGRGEEEAGRDGLWTRSIDHREIEGLFWWPNPVHRFETLDFGSSKWSESGSSINILKNKKNEKTKKGSINRMHFGQMHSHEEL